VPVEFFGDGVQFAAAVNK